MPKTRIGRKPRDPIKELVFGRKMAIGMTNADLALKTHMSRKQIEYVFKKPSCDWTIATTLKLTAALDIPIEEVRTLVGKS